MQLRSGIVAAGEPLYEATRYWMGGGPSDQSWPTPIFSGASSTNVIGTTLQCIELEGEFTEVQLIVANMSGSQPIEYVGASAVAVADFSDKKQDALFASEAKMFSFGGAPGITVPVRSGRNSPTLAVSDWLPIAAKQRTDGSTAPAGSKRSDGSLPFLLYVRLAQRVWDSTGMRVTRGQRMGSDWGTGRAQIWCANNTGAPTANLTGAFSPTPVASNDGFTGYTTLAGVRYRSRTKIMTVMLGGSSLSEGGADSGKTYAGFQRAFNDLSTVARPIETANHGMSTNSSTNARIGCVYAIPIIRPSHMCWEFYNPNDVGGGNLTQGQMDTIEATLESNRQQVFASIEAIGGKGFVWNGIPRNTGDAAWYSSTGDGYRLAILNRLLGRAFEVADVNGAIQDGSSPQRIRRTANGFAANETGDGLHINGAGYTAALSAFATPVNNLSAAF